MSALWLFLIAACLVASIIIIACFILPNIEEEIETTTLICDHDVAGPDWDGNVDEL